MDPERERINDDLRGLIKGEVRCDDVAVSLYATDGSLYSIRPLAVVRPRGTADVVATVQYAAQHKLPVFPRGAGTGLAGESLGAGIVLDFSRFMRRVLAVEEDCVRLQPGVVHAQLNALLRPRGLHFGPDPSTSSVTTMGSVIAIDAGGSHWLRYGSARRHVRSLQVVLADGAVLEVSREPLAGPNFDPHSRRGRLAAQLAELISREAALVKQYRPQTPVNCSGYQLADVLGEGQVDLRQLLVGSEGTLAIVTEATLGVSPLPRHRGVALLYFDRIENAAKAVLEILPTDPSACDLMDRRHVALARESNPAFDPLVPAEAEAALLVEYDGASLAEVRERLTATADRIRRKKRLAFHAVHTQDQDEVELYWRLSRKVVPVLHGLKGSVRPLPFIEDLAVPPPALQDFLVRLQNVLKQHQVTASLYAHAGHGQLHLRPFLDLAKPGEVARMAQLAADLYAAVIECGGTISGEHGDGLSRTPFLRQQYGPLVDVFREVKRIFDPDGILNPGKIVNDDPELLTRNLRPTQLAVAASGDAATAAAAELPGDGPALPTIKLQLRWTLDELADAAAQCNGCGGCRSQLPDVRMCPLFRIGPAEEASPRAKANLVRGLVTGQMEAAAVASDEFQAVADLCVHCHMCRLECPAGVDIPKLMVEAKAQHIASGGLSTTDWLLSRIDLVSALGSRLSWLANWTLRNRTLRWTMDRFLGIAQRRKLPQFARQSFLRTAARRRLTRTTRRSGKKVLYFVDTFANYHDPQLGEALVVLLEHNAVAVYVHPGQYAAGMALVAAGVVDKARKLAARNVALLAEAIRQGYHVVATEPSAVLCLTHEYPLLVDDDDARLVAENTSEACHYLWKLHQVGLMQLDLRPINAVFGYHLPCHTKALGIGSPAEQLLRLIPGLIVRRIEGGCSGMAGTFGLKQANFRASLRAGRALMNAVRSPQVQAGTTECSTCRLQMEQGTDKPTIHPLKLLALSYGLMPEVAELLAARGEELVAR